MWWRKALAENGGEEFVSAGSDEPLRGIDELREPTVALVRVSQRCRWAIVRRRLASAERSFSELAETAAAAAAAFVRVLFTCRCHEREKRNRGTERERERNTEKELRIREKEEVESERN